MGTTLRASDPRGLEAALSAVGRSGLPIKQADRSLLRESLAPGSLDPLGELRQLVNFVIGIRAALKVREPQVDLRTEMPELDVVQFVALLLGQHDSDGSPVALDDHRLAPGPVQQLAEAGFGVVGRNAPHEDSLELGSIRPN